MQRLPRVLGLGATALGAVLVMTGCSASQSSMPSPTTGAPRTPTAQITGSGTVDVLYAGSLVDLMEQQIGPAFDKRTGFTFQGNGAGSSALATQIKGRTTRADVFISASPSVDETLRGSDNGDWVRWYATFASSKLVIGYNPKSRFAEDLRTKPWYDVIGEPGFRFGSTDADLDPKGKLGNEALEHAASKHDKPALAALAQGFDGVQPEESLVGRLQAGQLDAAFFYASEAKAAKIPTVAVTGEDLKAVYTITELNGAANSRGAQAFIQYLLGEKGRSVLERNGYDVVAPATVTGSGVPESLDGVVAK